MRAGDLVRAGDLARAGDLEARVGGVSTAGGGGGGALIFDLQIDQRR